MSDKAVEATIKPLVESPEQTLENKGSDDNRVKPESDNRDVVEEKGGAEKYSEPQILTSSYSSNDFSKRMKEYKKKLSFEEQESMEQAAKTFQHESESIVVYPTEDSIKPVEKNTRVDIKDELSAPIVEENIIQSENIADSDVKESVAHTQSKTEYTVSDVQAETSSETIVKGKVADKQAINPLAVQNESVNVQDKALQQQIRDRQKQLQDQMVLLIPLTSKKKTEKKPDKYRY
ncbi:MAG: hypothetical protein KZQ64_13915 [gamma proteobacterium symbiont of Bathyaustriella thionipta]|nr:hypothetical protein [gamma proteobacterium symbiont of Bathyaustriella thionipta]